MAFNPLSPEWPKQTADTIDRLVGKVRDLFTVRAVKLTNAIVFGLVAAFAGFVAALLGMIISIKAVQSYLRWDLGTAAAWVIGSIALVGVLLLLVGAVKSSAGVIGAGIFVLLVAGARWALDAGEVRIDHDTAVWISYMVVGGFFLFVGAVLMAKRHSPVESKA